MKLALIGRSMISPFGLAIRPRMPASWRIWENEPRAPELAIIAIGFSGVRCARSALPTSSVARSHRSVTASWRSSWVISPSRYLPSMPADLRVVAPEDLPLARRGLDVVLGERHAGAGRVLEADVLERVEHHRDRAGAVLLHELVDQLGRVLLAHRPVHELVVGWVELVAQRLGQRPLDRLVVDDPPDGGQDVAALQTERPVLGQVVQLDRRRARRTTPPPGAVRNTCGRGSTLGRVHLRPDRSRSDRRSGSRRPAPCPATASPAARRAPGTGCCWPTASGSAPRPGPRPTAADGPPSGRRRSRR